MIHSSYVHLNSHVKLERGIITKFRVDRWRYYYKNFKNTTYIFLRKCHYTKKNIVINYISKPTKIFVMILVK